MQQHKNEKDRLIAEIRTRTETNINLLIALFGELKELYKYFKAASDRADREAKENEKDVVRGVQAKRYQSITEAIQKLLREETQIAFFLQKLHPSLSNDEKDAIEKSIALTNTRLIDEFKKIHDLSDHDLKGYRAYLAAKKTAASPRQKPATSPSGARSSTAGANAVAVARPAAASARPAVERKASASPTISPPPGTPSGGATAPRAAASPSQSKIPAAPSFTFSPSAAAIAAAAASRAESSSTAARVVSGGAEQKRPPKQRSGTRVTTSESPSLSSTVAPTVEVFAPVSTISTRATTPAEAVSPTSTPPSERVDAPPSPAPIPATATPTPSPAAASATPPAAPASPPPIELKIVPPVTAVEPIPMMAASPTAAATPKSSDVKIEAPKTDPTTIQSYPELKKYLLEIKAPIQAKLLEHDLSNKKLPPDKEQKLRTDFNKINKQLSLIELILSKKSKIAALESDEVKLLFQSNLNKFESDLKGTGLDYSFISSSPVATPTSAAAASATMNVSPPSSPAAVTDVKSAAVPAAAPIASPPPETRKAKFERILLQTQNELKAFESQQASGKKTHYIEQQIEELTQKVAVIKAILRADDDLRSRPTDQQFVQMLTTQEKQFKDKYEKEPEQLAGDIKISPREQAIRNLKSNNIDFRNLEEKRSTLIATRHTFDAKTDTYQKSLRELDRKIEHHIHQTLLGMRGEAKENSSLDKAISDSAQKLRTMQNMAVPMQAIPLISKYAEQKISLEATRDALLKKMESDQETTTTDDETDAMLPAWHSEVEILNSRIDTLTKLLQLEAKQHELRPDDYMGRKLIDIEIHYVDQKSNLEIDNRRYDIKTVSLNHLIEIAENEAKNPANKDTANRAITEYQAQIKSFQPIIARNSAALRTLEADYVKEKAQATSVEAKSDYEAKQAETTINKKINEIKSDLTKYFLDIKDDLSSVKELKLDYKDEKERNDLLTRLIDDPNIVRLHADQKVLILKFLIVGYLLNEVERVRTSPSVLTKGTDIASLLELPVSSLFLNTLHRKKPAFIGDEFLKVKVTDAHGSNPVSLGNRTMRSVKSCLEDIGQLIAKNFTAAAPVARRDNDLR